MDTELLRARARKLAEDVGARDTLQAYESGMGDFEAWSAAQYPPLEPSPAWPMTMALYGAVLVGVRLGDPAAFERHQRGA